LAGDFDLDAVVSSGVVRLNQTPLKVEAALPM